MDDWSLSEKFNRPIHLYHVSKMGWNFTCSDAVKNDELLLKSRTDALDPAVQENQIMRIHAELERNLNRTPNLVLGL